MQLEDYLNLSQLQDDLNLPQIEDNLNFWPASIFHTPKVLITQDL